MIEFGEQNAQTRFKPGKTAGSINIFAILFFRGMRRMIRDNHVNSTVKQPRQKSFVIFLSAKRRIYFCGRIGRIYQIFSHRQMLWSDLGSNFYAAFFCLTNNIDRPRRTHVSYMNSSARIFRKKNISGNRNIFRNRRTTFQTEHRAASSFVHYSVFDKRSFFFVANNNFIRRVKIIKSIHKNFCVVVKMPVVRKSCNACGNHIV